MDFAKENHFSHFEILQHVYKNPKGIGQYSKNIKILFLGIHYSLLIFGEINPKGLISKIFGWDNLLLFTVDFWKNNS